MTVIREVLSSQTLPHTVLPAHGPGCRPLTGLRSARFLTSLATSAARTARAATRSRTRSDRSRETWIWTGVQT
jgi:hypothetical protein